MTGPPTAATASAFAPWWFDRVWTMQEICIITSTRYDTVFRWFQLVRTTGVRFGQKRGRDWNFSAHELYIFRLLAAFNRASIPIGPTQIRAIVAFAFDVNGASKIPEGRLIQAAPNAEFAVDAVRIFNAVIDATNPANEDVRAKYS